MVREVVKLFEQTNVNELGIFVMGGHTDGIVAFGETAEKAWQIMLDFASKAS